MANSRSAGQWLGYKWLTAAQGARLGPMYATQEFALKEDAWSQQLGFALFVAAERFSDHKTLMESQRQGQTIIEFINEYILDN